LLDAKKTIYVLRHSPQDLEACEKIKNSFSNNKNVRLIADELNVIELENIIKQFDFVIASRYHSIINSYKNGVPALVIGWAAKYFELLENFNQLDYFFDVRSAISTDDLLTKLDKLIESCKYEKEKIIEKFDTLNKENIFELLNGEDFR